MEPINADDVVVKFASIFESEWEVLKITNMLRDDVRKMLKDMASLDEKEWDAITFHIWKNRERKSRYLRPVVRN